MKTNEETYHVIGMNADNVVLREWDVSAHNIQAAINECMEVADDYYTMDLGQGDLYGKWKVFANITNGSYTIY